METKKFDVIIANQEQCLSKCKYFFDGMRSTFQNSKSDLGISETIKYVDYLPFSVKKCSCVWSYKELSSL